jgi:hypothetical protein
MYIKLTESTAKQLYYSSMIDGDPLRFRGEVYHPYHFNCTACSVELTASAREVRTRPGYTANELVMETENIAQWHRINNIPLLLERAVLPSLPRQDGHTHMWCLQETNRGESRHCTRYAICCRLGQKSVNTYSCPL